MDPDQIAPLGAVRSGSTLFAYMLNVSLKSLQEDAADDINIKQSDNTTRTEGDLMDGQGQFGLTHSKALA